MLLLVVLDCQSLQKCVTGKELAKNFNNWSVPSTEQKKLKHTSGNDIGYRLELPGGNIAAVQSSYKYRRRVRQVP